MRVGHGKPVRAFLIENDWEKAKGGEDYVRQLGPNGERVAVALAHVQRRHDGRVRRWVSILQPARAPPERPEPAPAQPQQ